MRQAWRWFKQNVFYISASRRLGIFVYLHVFKSHTYDVSLQWGRRIKHGSPKWLDQQCGWSAIARSGEQTERGLPNLGSSGGS